MAKTIAEYYATNYSRCEPDDSFFASWKGLAYTSHLTQLFACPVQLLTFYLIIFKTPSAMKCMVCPLLFSHIWCSAMDFSFGTLSPPYLFYPHGALFGCGFLNSLGIPIVVLIIPGMFVIFSMAISLIFLFESRSSALHTNKFRIKSRTTRLAYYTVNYLVYTPTFLILLNIPENQDFAKLEALKTMPCPTREFFTEPTFVVFSDPDFSNFLIFRIFSSYILITTAQMWFYIGCIVYYLFINPSCIISARTRQYQIHFFYGIVVQTVVPLILIVLTYSILIAAILTDGVTQGLINMCIVTVGVHGLVESLVIILIHGAYRRAVLSFFCKIKDLKSELEFVSCQN
ncbi:hypothetical protein CRE_18983 [Caenorhabditis remanei]|uniref:Serpentine Receptor, class H n=1 Tax=Caenorhabditis remanei TaxID=31234 RepID=E3LKX7_CAERE|nr:hypothetical protein CRE_18983 [Caenorhabditis remanei]